jgi:hypothetical protein
VNQLAFLKPVTGIRRGCRQSVFINLAEQMRHQVWHRQTHVNIQTIRQMLDVQNAYIQIELEVCRRG